MIKTSCATILSCPQNTVNITPIKNTIRVLKSMGPTTFDNLIDSPLPIGFVVLKISLDT